jgi:beta-barrel assembly-enhancing protease
MNGGCYYLLSLHRTKPGGEGMRRYATGLLLAAVLTLMVPLSAFSQRTPLKPGKWNLFKPQQDIELGRQVAQDAEKKLPMLNNSRVDDYLSRLGKKLAANAPGEKYPYQFKCVNDAEINAFALPGGFLFVNRGTIEAADNEAELAGVIGHEIGHVALRHGTNQATKQYLTQVPLAIFGGALGSNSVTAILAQIGTGFAFNSVLLKYSRDDERQADLMGTQILFDTNYDPRYLATFFDKLDTKGRGSSFFSSHPSPENRKQDINAEISKLGVRSGASSDSSEFQSIRKYVKSFPPAPKINPDESRDSGAGQPRQQERPARPSNRFQSYDAGNLSVRHPDNWKAYGERQAFTLAPDGGIVKNGNEEALAYGAIMAVHQLDAGSGSRSGLKDATNQLIQQMQSSNPGMRLSKDQGQIRVGGQAALSEILTNNSPAGERETDWLVTILRPEGLVYFVFVAPESEFGDYQRTFKQILDSVSFR